MKKNLRLLCLGLAAATFTCGFAQDDVTSELKNADMELGLKGWAFDGTDYVGKNTKNVNDKVGFHGMNNGVQEAWHSDANNPLGDSYVMQRVKKLPAGTYVFGAYAGAAKQTRNQKESNRDSIVGVSLFANDAKVAVATDNPDLGRSGSSEGKKWAHTSKFNVATKVSDEGTLLVGLKVENTTANYIVWDNATLYYFHDMDEAAALDEMAKIDMKNAAAIADTLVKNNIKMQEDTLKNLKKAIEKYIDGKNTTAATLWDDSEDLFWNMGLARRSATDYANLLKKIEFAAYIKDSCVWSEAGYEIYGGEFEVVLKDALKAYDEAEAGRAELSELTNELDRQIGWVRVDSFEIAKQALQNFINDAKFTNAPGEYSTAQKNQLQAFADQMRDTLKNVEDLISDNEDRPQDLYPYIAQAYAQIEAVKSNPIPTSFTEMPIVYERSKTTKLASAAGEHYYIEGAMLNSDNLVSFNSPLYRFPNKVEKFRITVHSSGSQKDFFCLSELEFLDGEGQRIELTEENVTSNADHNTLNPGAEDGGGIPALFDQNTETFFHSAWQNMPSEDHYLEVTLPNNGYDMFSFKMIARKDKSKGGDQHNFPGEMTINTPTPERDAMAVVLNAAKELNAYCGTDPGFLTGEEGPEVYAELAAAIVEAELLIANNGAESKMSEAKERLSQAVNNYKMLEGDKVYNVPVAGKVYRIVSGFPGFFNIQGVEKALTVHAADTTLWWENVCADSLQQEFVFEPYLDEDGEPFVQQVATGKKNDDGSDILEPIYCFKLKNVATGLYVDSAFVNNQVKLVKEATDTVKLKWLARGQWNIMLKNGTLHAGDHNSGNVGGTGFYGGTAGVSSGIVSWDTGLDGASAWFVREYPVMPYDVAVEAGAYKSDFVHFDATDSLTLTADAACAFEKLALYDLYGSPISFDVEVNGAVATVKTENVISGCAFAFNNNESVATVTLDIVLPEAVVEDVDVMAQLEEKLEAVVAVAPEQGTAVGQYDDITKYTETVAAAEAMVEAGAEDDAIKAMIAELDSAVASLTNPHLPEAGKYYFIVSGLSAFEEKQSYNMALYTEEGNLKWAQENELNDSRCWMFEPVSVAELFSLGLDTAKVESLISVANGDTTVNAFYIKNLGSGEYFGNITKAAFQTDAQVPTASSKAATVPYKVSMLGAGTVLAFDDVVDGQRIHGKGHGGGANKSGGITYWNSGVETASAWRIVETENDFVIFSDLDFTEIEPEAPVVKGVYDLFGRRLVAPTTPGIYIIDGKKRVIK